MLLPASRFFRNLKSMEVHFSSRLEARLTQRATQQGRKPDEFVQDVVARYLDEEDRFVAAVKRGEDALEHGEYLTHEQVGERLRRFLQP
jgi:predicted transcriptional regulator